jgi:GntR family transcriptional regulator of abcA and norABC
MERRNIMKQTLYMQIADKISQYIKTNQLQPGDKLPTYREFANLFNASVHTVGNAIERLHYKGIVDIRPQSGIFVMEEAWKILSPKAFNWQAYFSKPKEPHSELFRRFSKSRTIYEGRLNQHVLSNIGLAPEFGGYDVWKKAVNKALNNVSAQSLFIPTLDELDKYNHAIKQYMDSYGLNLPEESILLAKNTNFSLLLIALTLFAPGTQCFYVSPSILDVSSFFEMVGLVKIPLPIDDDGIDLEYFSQRINRGGKAFIVVSPELALSGARMSMKRRKELYHLCHTNNIIIVELDEFREFSSTSLPPIKSLDRHGIVIYVSTFAHSLNNSAEVGWISASPELIERLSYMYISMWIGVEILLQQALYEMLTDGSYAEYTTSLRSSMRGRENRLNALLERHIGDIATWSQSAEVFYWIKFDNRIDVSKLVNNSEGLTMSSNAQHIFAPKNSIFVNLMGINDADLEPAIRQLGEIARKSI